MKEILAKLPARRTPEEVSELMALISKVDFFQDKPIKEKDMSELCSSFNLHHVPQGQDVFQYGATGDTFYLILQGAVSVKIPN